MENRLWIKFEQQKVGNELLLLYLRASIPLRRVVQELPEIGENFIRARASASVKNSQITDCMELHDVLSAAFESSIDIKFSGLPEPIFERLVLRFRPFYANNETINFLTVVNQLAKQNHELREWCGEWRIKWKRAVFWGAMGMPAVSPKVSAEKIIEAAFYSRYFHYDSKKEQQVCEYERALGKDILRVALVSSVWQRSLLTVSLAEDIQRYLLRAGLLQETTLSDMNSAYDQPTKATLSLLGGVGGLKVTPIG